MVILQDQPLPIHHNRWAAFCACGGSFRIPAAIYDRDAKGQLTFVRPLLDSDPEADAPTSFEMAFVPRGDQEALEAALHKLKRGDLTANEAADVVEQAAPGLSWASDWLRERGDELNKNQLGIVLGIISLLLTLYTMGRPAQFSSQQMDEMIQEVSTSAPQQPSEEDIGTVVQRHLDKARRQGPIQQFDRTDPPRKSSPPPPGNSPQPSGEAGG